MACQIWHCRWCHPVAHTHANSSKHHLLAKQRRKGASVSQEKSSHDSMCPLSSQCTHLTWNKVDNTTVSETLVSPWTTLHHTDETGWHRSANRPVVWAWQPAALIPSCLYLPGLSHRFTHTETCTETHGADFKAMPLLPWMWLIVRLLDAVSCTDRNKHIRHKKKKKLGNVSVSIWVRQHEEAGDGEGSPLTFPMCICVHLVDWSWHWKQHPCVHA